MALHREVVCFNIVHLWMFTQDFRGCLRLVYSRYSSNKIHFERSLSLTRSCLSWPGRWSMFWTPSMRCVYQRLKQNFTRGVFCTIPAEEAIQNCHECKQGSDLMTKTAPLWKNGRTLASLVHWTRRVHINIEYWSKHTWTILSTHVPLNALSKIKKN